MEPGAAAGLAALALDRAQTWEAFRAALARWKMPPRQFVYADADGNVGRQAAALAPVRRSGEWRGWMTLEDLPHAFNPPSGAVHASAPAPALAAVVRDALFAHPLGVTAAARARFNIGPIARPSGNDAPVRGSFNPANWDESQVIDAPGQSESPSSPHFSDGAASWSAGKMFPLVFTKGAIDANAESTLRLIPRR
jgi:acyl-homoserine lactone acylase PvdQ